MARPARAIKRLAESPSRSPHIGASEESPHWCPHPPDLSPSFRFTRRFWGLCECIRHGVPMPLFCLPGRHQSPKVAIDHRVPAESKHSDSLQPTAPEGEIKSTPFELFKDTARVRHPSEYETCWRSSTDISTSAEPGGSVGDATCTDCESEPVVPNSE